MRFREWIRPAIPRCQTLPVGNFALDAGLLLDAPDEGPERLLPVGVSGLPGDSLLGALISHPQRPTAAWRVVRRMGSTPIGVLTA